MCYGATQASILQSDIGFAHADSGGHDGVGYMLVPINLPKMITPSAEGIEKQMVVVDPMGYPTAPTFFIHVYFFVRYRDVFQTRKQWVMRSRYVWRVYGGTDTGNPDWVEHAQEDEEAEIELDA
jgi:hypothetical protein